MTNESTQDTVCTEADGCPTEKAVLQRFWRNLRDNIAEQREHVKSQAADSHWWKGYVAALYWIEREAFVGDVGRAARDRSSAALTNVASVAEQIKAAMQADKDYEEKFAKGGDYVPADMVASIREAISAIPRGES